MSYNKTKATINMLKTAKQIAEYNVGKINPDEVFNKQSPVRAKLLAGKLTFPLTWAVKHPVGHVSTEGLRSDACFRKALQIDEELALQLYERQIIDITMDTLYDSCSNGSELALDIANDMLSSINDIPNGYWTRTMSLCLHALMCHEFTEKIQSIATKLINRGANINYIGVGGHIMQALVQRCHKVPKSLTPNKLEFMLQNGLNLSMTYSPTSGIVYIPQEPTLEYLFTSGIPIDDLIQMLYIIKQYTK